MKGSHSPTGFADGVKVPIPRAVEVLKGLGKVVVLSDLHFEQCDAEWAREDEPGGRERHRHGLGLWGGRADLTDIYNPLFPSLGPSTPIQRALRYQSLAN